MHFLLVLLIIMLLSCGPEQNSVPPGFTPEPEAIPPGMMQVRDIHGSLKLDIRYAGSNNFVGSPLSGYEFPFCFLRESTARALLEAAEEAKRRGLVLVIFDCYRPWRANVDMVEWARNTGNTELTGIYIPAQNVEQANPSSARISHMSGNTVDLGFVSSSFYQNQDWSHVPDSQTIRSTFGAGFDEFSPVSWVPPPSSVQLEKQQLKNRFILQEIMGKAGFTPYSREWWHFSKRDDPGPGWDIPLLAKASNE